MAKLPDELRSIRGMNDHVPPLSKKWQAMEQTLMVMANAYGFSLVKTPIIEPTGLFVRGIGESTDIVDKEMYSFIDQLNGQSLTLRPENTASCVRAYFEHGLQRSGVQRWVYMGPMFRHERPQKGRYRQFHQMGLEILGSNAVAADIELIAFTDHLWRKLAIPSPRLEINTLGEPEERKAHRSALLAHWQEHVAVLDEEAKARMTKNPLRLLDSKNPDMMSAIQSAPTLIDFLGKASRDRFEQLQKGLSVANIPFIINPRLVRGLDYYNHTVFEWITECLGAQGTICGGGRYDGLGPMLASSELSATGLAIGLERLFELIPDTPQDVSKRSVYIAHEGGDTLWQAIHVAQRVRQSDGWQVVFHYEGGKWNNQIRKAVEFPCRYIIMVGARELEGQTLSIKDLSASDSTQISIDIQALPQWLLQH